MTSNEYVCPFTLDLYDAFLGWLRSDRRADIILPAGWNQEIVDALLANEQHFPGVLDYWVRSHDGDEEEWGRYCELKYDIMERIQGEILDPLEAAGIDSEGFEGASAKAVWAIIAGPYIKAMRELEDDIAAGIIEPLDLSEVARIRPGPR